MIDFKTKMALERVQKTIENAREANLKCVSYSHACHTLLVMLDRLKDALEKNDWKRNEECDGILTAMSAQAIITMIDMD